MKMNQGQRRFLGCGHWRSIFVSLCLAFAIAPCITPARIALAQQVEVAQPDRVMAMLEAINKIRKRRDIKLDCEVYVYPYLGRSDRLKHYLDLFAAQGIAPTVARQYERRHIGFRIDFSHLRKVKKSKFGGLDTVVIGFWADGQEPNSVIQSCAAVLFAAPQHL